MAGPSIFSLPEPSLLPGGYREGSIQAAAGQLGSKKEHLLGYFQSALEDTNLTLTEVAHIQWCGIFVLWALKQAGLAHGIKWPIGRTFLTTGPCPLTVTQSPQAGDVSYLAVPFGHHSLIESVEGDVIRTIDGNQGPPDYIARRSHKRGSGHAYYSISPLIDRAVAALNAGSARSSSE